MRKRFPGKLFSIQLFFEVLGWSEGRKRKKIKNVEVKRKGEIRLNWISSEINIDETERKEIERDEERKGSKTKLSKVDPWNKNFSSVYTQQKEKLLFSGRESKEIQNHFPYRFSYYFRLKFLQRVNCWCCFKVLLFETNNHRSLT